MRKIFVAVIAAGAVGVVWADAATNQEQFRDQPEARAYLSYNFGGHDNRHVSDAPFHYGLRLDHDSRLRAAAGAALPPLLQVDHDNRGETLALANGVPFAARNLRLNQDSGGGTSGGNDSGWTFFDWSLLAVGIGGAGYLIYNATKGKNSPNGTSSTGSTTGSTTGLVNTVTGVVTGVVNTVTGVVTGVVNTVTGYSGSRAVQGVLPFDPVDRGDPSYQKWLDGGHGQMGDLGG